MSNRLRASAVITGLLVFNGLSLGCGDGRKDLIGPTALAVTSVSPETGPTDAISNVRIVGRGFQTGATVTLGGAATNVRVLGSTQITATAPMHPAGTVDVVVTNPGGETATLPEAFRYQLPTPASLVVFTESASGFSTTDLRDAQEQVLQLNTANELIWTADGTRLPGYQLENYGVPGVAFISGRICSVGCAFEVRFGTKDGERRAYLTVDYGHDNPGTVVDVEVSGGALVVTQTGLYPPGTFTLSGTVTETTAAGEVPVEGAWVARPVSTGWRQAITDKDGVYSLPGMSAGTAPVTAGKDGYQNDSRVVSITADTRVDIRLVRR